MSQYKVPQDVEADDKLIGPFSFRQFVYLMIAGGAVALAFALSRIFPILFVVPMPVVFFFLILALPLKKDQPMETYLAALISFYLKPNKRVWTPGQRESTIIITVPKKKEVERTRNITQEEASHRLSFLAELVDSEGHSIKNPLGPIKEEYVLEANGITDMMDNNISSNIDQIISQEQTNRHNELINQMRTAIARTESLVGDDTTPLIQKHAPNPTSPAASPFQPLDPNTPYPTNVIEPTPPPPPPPAPVSPNIIQPIIPELEKPVTKAAPSEDLINLANNSDFSIQTIQKEANRIQNNNDKEVFISLH